MEIFAMREMFWTGLQSVGGGGVICPKKGRKGGAITTLQNLKGQSLIIWPHASNHYTNTKCSRPVFIVALITVDGQDCSPPSSVKLR